MPSKTIQEVVTWLLVPTQAVQIQVAIMYSLVRLPDMLRVQYQEAYLLAQMLVTQWLCPML